MLPKEPRTWLPVLGIIQLRTFRKKPLVREAVVSRQHLKMSQEVHSPELTSDDNGARTLDQEFRQSESYPKTPKRAREE
jgi:hypothetical protein